MSNEETKETLERQEVAQKKEVEAALARQFAAQKKEVDAALTHTKDVVKDTSTALNKSDCSAEDVNKVKEVINLVKVETANVNTDANSASQSKNLKENISMFNKIKTKLATLAKSGNKKLDALLKPLKAAIDRTILKLKSFVDSLERKFWKKSSDKPENANHRDKASFGKHNNKSKR